MALLFGAVGLSVSAETVLKFAAPVPENTPWGSQIHRLAAAVAEESDGRLRVDPFFNAQLGTAPEAVAQLARGRIEMGVFSIAMIASQVPEIEVVRNFAFFETNRQQACAQENHLRQAVTSVLKARDLHFGAWADGGTTYLVSDREIAAVEDLAGLKVGTTASKSSRDFWLLFGAIPKALAVSEAPTAASTGLIEAAALAYPLYLATGINASLPVVSEYRVTRTNGIFLVSGRVYDSLSPADQEALDRAFARFTTLDLMTEVDAFEDLLRQRHLASGGRVHQPAQEEVARLRARLPEFWAGIASSHGETGQHLWTLMKLARADCAG